VGVSQRFSRTATNRKAVFKNNKVLKSAQFIKGKNTQADATARAENSYSIFYVIEIMVIRIILDESQPVTAISTLGRMEAAVAKAAWTGWFMNFPQRAGSSPAPRDQTGSACCIRR